MYLCVSAIFFLLFRGDVLTVHSSVRTYILFGVNVSAYAYICYFICLSVILYFLYMNVELNLRLCPSKYSSAFCLSICTQCAYLCCSSWSLSTYILFMFGACVFRYVFIYTVLFATFAFEDEMH